MIEVCVDREVSAVLDFMKTCAHEIGIRNEALDSC
jgi:hypothetical protein